VNSRVLIATSCIVAVSLLASAGCAGLENGHVSQNKAILRSLPIFPGAREIDRTTSPYYQHDGEGAIAGYITRARFRLPSGTPPERVGRFYRSRLRRSWRLHEHIDEADGPVFNFRRGTATISINLHVRGILDISVDSDSFFLKTDPGF
jgi:hypothetical protein